MKGISEYSLGIILVLFFLNTNFIIPIANLTIPVYDFIVIFLFIYFNLRNTRQNMLYDLNGHYLKYICISLIFVSILIFLSIIVGLFFYEDTILLNDLFSIIIPIRLVLYVLVGAHLASMDNKKIFGEKGVLVFFLILGLAYSVCISFIQYLYIIGFNIPLISEYSISFIPKRYYNLRIVGPSGNPNWNSFDLNLIVIISFALFRLAINKRSKIQIIILIILMTFILFLVFVTFSRTGIITLILLLLLLLYTILKKPKIKHYISVFILLISFYTVGSFMIGENKDMVNKRIESTLKIQEGGQRAHLWASRIKESSKRFPFGVGPSRNSLLDIVDSQFVLTYGDSGFFGFFIYLLMVLYLMIKPLSLLSRNASPNLSILLFITISLGVIMFNYSMTTELMRNMRASSILLMLHSYFYYKNILIKTYLIEYNYHKK